MRSLLPGIRIHRRAVALLLLFCYLPACTTWQVGSPTPAQPTPAEFITNKQPPSVQITRSDGSTLEVSEPVIRNDSLVGFSGNTMGGLAHKDSSTVVSIPLSDVQSIAIKKKSNSSPGVLIVALAGAIGLLALIAGGGVSTFK